ncbi:hypothetical protein DNTS_024408 [Danionella cerebrum]|uniref:INO80 complex subunit E n=1 Tax=Danionella cerebrum TaxID=2873325 RepID=A0A553N210_9TELE|nr:hypothetical protein DNTS_024408 [Danionella translucida]
MLPRLTALLFYSAVFQQSSQKDLDPGFLQCQDCFFKETPPHSLSEQGLEPLCHRHLTGRPFASLFNSNCQSTVFTALQLSLNNGWGRGEQSTVGVQEGINGNPLVAVPALYRETPDETQSPTPFQRWDSLTADLIQNSIIPQCSEVNGKIYVQTGVSGFNECGGKLLWSAVCCAASEGDTSFSFGLVKAWDIEVLSINELEELIGVTGLFAGGCGEMRLHRGDELKSLLETHLNGIKKHFSEALTENNKSKPSTQETGSSELLQDNVFLEQVNAETSNLSADMDVGESTKETESSESFVVSFLSSVIYFFYVPFSPLVNRVINFPFQVVYVLQEDLSVLVSVPCDCYILVENLISGVSSGICCIFNNLVKAVETTVGMVYTCLSPLASSLALTFQEGVFGIGTLISEALEFLIETVEKCFSLFGMLFGSVLEVSVDYMSTVSSEMGHQTSVVGSGIGTMTWRSGRAVGHIFNFVTFIVGGILGNTMINIQEAFGICLEEESVMLTPTNVCE